MSNITLDPGERIAKANGLELCYQSFGAEENPTLLLIMGLGAQMVVWDDGFCEALAARGYWVTRFDNRDIGRSTKIDVRASNLMETMIGLRSGQPIAAPYLLKDMAADTIGLLNVLSARDAHIVGASMGGMIAQELAIHWPHRVKSLTSIMSSTGDPNLPPPTPEALSILMAPPPRTAEEYIEANVRTWRILRNGDFPEEETRDRTRATRAAGRGFEPEGVARQLLAMMASGSRKSALSSVRAPTLVIHGANDPLIPLAAGEDTARSIPNAKLVVIERMGHTMPRAVWPRVLDEISAIAR